LRDERFARQRVRQRADANDVCGLAKAQRRGNLGRGVKLGSSLVTVVHSTSAAPDTESRQRSRAAALAWLPAALLGAGIVLGVVLWSKWGFAIAFEAIRAYCF
jgi:hypothetical protein